MPENKLGPSESLLDRNAMLQQASALAEHLQRSGVQFVPRANSNHVAELLARFATDGGEDLPATSAGVPTLPAGSSSAAASRKSTESVPSKPFRSAFARPAGERIGASAYGSKAESLDKRTSRLEAMAAEVAECQRCPQLVRCRTQTVFGEGSPVARFVFFGEGPGADEDRTGRPFVGKAGQLLTKMIEACKLSREEVYILNTVKCRPPGNRNPNSDEIENCREYFEKQLSLIQPEYIICLGAVSGQTLLQSTLPVGQLRGKIHRYYGSKVVVTYHPAYLLRTPLAKKAAWEDLQMMLRDARLM